MIDPQAASTIIRKERHHTADLVIILYQSSMGIWTGSPAADRVKSLTAAELAIVLGDGVAIREILSEGTTVGQMIEKYLKRKEACLEKGLQQGGRRLEVSMVEGPPLKSLWEHDMKKCIDGNPLIIRHNEEDYVVAASHSGMIVCRNHTQRAVHWEHTFQGRRFEASPALSDGAVIIGSYDGHLVAVDFLTGRLMGSHLFEETTIRAEAAVYRDVVFVIGYKNAGAELIMFRWRDRQQKAVPLTAGSTASPVVLPEKRMIIATTIRGTVEAFRFSCEDDLHLEPLWTTSNIKAIFSAVCVDSESAVVTSADGVVSKLNISTGQLEKTVNLGEAFFSTALFIHDVYLAPSQKGSIFALDKDTLEVLRVFSFAECSFVKAPSIYLIPHENTSFLALISKDGRLLIVRSSDILSHKSPLCISYKIGTGEIFGELRIVSDSLFIGSRDDHLRAICFPDLIDYC